MKITKTAVASVICGADLTAAPALALAAPDFAASNDAAHAAQYAAPCPHPPAASSGAAKPGAERMLRDAAKRVF